ncbi:MAG: hypothetical protein ACRDJ3_02170 [Solirubrobacteraceae bacterium]
MSGAPVRNDAPQRLEPHLYLVDGPEASSGRADRQERETAWEGTPADHPAHVLVAGTDAVVRTRMLEELRDLLPVGTPFAQASETWEVIAGAPASSMVVLAGDLSDVSSGAVMRLLARRYPTLPVLAVAEKTPAHPAADVDVAHA